MTAPIQEPTDQRSISGLQWKTAQLARRPPLVAPRVNPWMAIFDGTAVVPTGTWMPVNFQQLAYDPLLVTLGDIFDYDTTDTGDTGNTRFRIQTRKKGVYYAELWTAWDEVLTDGANDHGYVVQDLFYNAHPNSLFGADPEVSTASADWPKNDTTGDFEIKDSPYLYSTWTIFLNANSKTWDPWALQTTGIDRGLTGQRLYVEYLPFSDVSTWTFEIIPASS